MLVFPLVAAALSIASVRAEDYRLTVYVEPDTSAAAVCSHWKATCKGIVQTALKSKSCPPVQQICEDANASDTSVEAFCRYNGKDYTKKVAGKLHASLTKPTPPKFQPTVVRIRNGQEKAFCSAFANTSLKSQGTCAYECAVDFATSTATCNTLSTGIVSTLCICHPQDQSGDYDDTKYALSDLQKKFDYTILGKAPTSSTSSSAATSSTSATSTSVATGKPSFKPTVVRTVNGKEKAFCAAFNNANLAHQGTCQYECALDFASASASCTKLSVGIVSTLCVCQPEDQTGDYDDTTFALDDLKKKFDFTVLGKAPTSSASPSSTSSAPASSASSAKPTNALFLISVNKGQESSFCKAFAGPKGSCALECDTDFANPYSACTKTGYGYVNGYCTCASDEGTSGAQRYDDTNNAVGDLKKKYGAKIVRQVVPFKNVR